MNTSSFYQHMEHTHTHTHMHTHTHTHIPNHYILSLFVLLVVKLSLLKISLFYVPFPFCSRMFSFPNKITHEASYSLARCHDTATYFIPKEDFSFFSFLTISFPDVNVRLNGFSRCNFGSHPVLDNINSKVLALCQKTEILYIKKRFRLYYLFWPLCVQSKFFFTVTIKRTDTH